MKPRSFLVALLLFFFFPIVAFAQNAPTYTGIDLIFMVDQSGSMGGRAFGFTDGGAGADPLGLRFEAVQYAIDTLGQYRLTLAPDMAIRAAVINFGDFPDDIDLAAGWHDIAANSDWETQRVALLKSLSKESFINRRNPDNLGNTNFLDAFAAAHQMFSQLPANEKHLRAIILLTDGAPCVPKVFDCEAPDASKAQQEHMNAVLAATQRDFPTSNYRIYVIALDANGSLWDRWHEDWEQIVGVANQAARSETSQQVGVRFVNILGDLVALARGTPNNPFTALVPGENSITVPPYIQEMRVSIFKSTTSPGVLDVVRPDGSPLSGGDPNLNIENRDRPIEVWEIRTPTPGNWTFKVGSTNDRIDVYLELIPIEVQAQVIGGSFIQNDDVAIKVKMSDSSGNPLTVYGTPYTLTTRAIITAPDGSKSELPLSTLPDGTFEANLTVTQRGSYQIGVIASTQTPDAHVYTVFDKPAVSSFKVVGVNFTADPLPQQQNLVGSQIEIGTKLTDENGAQLPLNNVSVVGELAQAGKTTVYNFTPTADGQYKLGMDFMEPGDYTLTLRASATRTDGNTLALGNPINVRFSVLPSQLVKLVQIEPETSDLQQNTTEGFPPFTPTDLLVKFEAQVENTLVNLDSLAVNPVSIWTVHVTKDGNPLDATVQSSTDGKYEVRISGLGTGHYTVEVMASGALTGTYMLDPSAKAINVNVERVVNPLYYATLIGAGVFVLVMISGSGLVVRRRQIRSKHPARGKLVIREQETGMVVLTVDLDAKRSNYLTIKNNHLRKANVTSLVITCVDDKMSQTRRVRVTARTDDKYIFRDRVLSPGDVVPLKKGDLFDVQTESINYELAKDPDESPFLFGA